MMDARSAVMVELIANLEAARIRNVDEWAVVTIDADNEQISNVVGPFDSPEHALVEAGRMDTDDAQFVADGEKGWTHVVVPLFAPRTD